MESIFDVESLDIKGQGVAHAEGKVVFIEGALPGEQVRARRVRSKKNYDKAVLTQVMRPSSLRVTPACPYFGVCGGCAMQHVQPSAQVAIKQRVLEDNLKHIGNVQPGRMLAPMHGPSWGYRYRARMSVRLVQKKGGVLVGFRERQSRYVTDMSSCLVLPPFVSDLIPHLRDLIGDLSIPDRIPQIEVAVGDAVTALVLRHLEPLSTTDYQKLEAFGSQHNVSWWLQAKGPDSVIPLLEGDEARLYYDLPEYNLRMTYRPTDFTQVNTQVNRRLVARALALLAPQAGERIADMFCGLGNFSLPLARSGAHVVGYEGSTTLTARAHALAQAHALDQRASFIATDLFEVDTAWLQGQPFFDRLLLDPPREGAVALVKALAELAPEARPTRIVYVSCNPATLARDAGILTHVGGYRLRAAGVMNMFPHTSHIESIAVFD